MNKRATIALAGGSVLAAATACLSPRAPDRARAPRRLGASLSPSPCSSPIPDTIQPWIAELSGEREIVVRRDPTLVPPRTDPFDRQLEIGMGCVLEHLATAAAERGHHVAMNRARRAAPTRSRSRA